MTRVSQWPPHLRHFAAAFVVVMLVGYAVGLLFVFLNIGGAPAGIADHYHGNEEAMSFGKSQGEMLTTIHSHLLGMGLLFFATGVVFSFSDFPRRWRALVMVETMLSLLTTFGGLYFVSIGWRGFVWLVYPSSVLMVLGYLTMSVTILRSCYATGRSGDAEGTSP